MSHDLRPVFESTGLALSILSETRDGWRMFRLRVGSVEPAVLAGSRVDVLDRMRMALGVHEGSPVRRDPSRSIDSILPDNVDRYLGHAFFEGFESLYFFRQDERQAFVVWADASGAVRSCGSIESAVARACCERSSIDNPPAP